MLSSMTEETARVRAVLLAGKNGYVNSPIVNYGRTLPSKGPRTNESSNRRSTIFNEFQLEAKKSCVWLDNSLPDFVSELLKLLVG